MTALAPAWLWWLALAVAAVVLHLVRPRPRTVPTTILAFWLGMDRRQAERPWLRRLKRLLALLLSVAIALAAVAAAARVVLGGAADGVRGVVLLVDRSASLGALGDDGRPRLDGVRAQLRARLAALPAAVPVTLLAYDARPALLVARTLDRAAVERALDGLVARPVAGDPAPALALAHRLARVDAPAALWHGTDRAAPDREEDGVRVATVVAPATAAANVGITAADLRRQPLERNRYGAFVQIEAAGAAPAETELEVALDGRTVEVRKLTVAPGRPERLAIPVAAGDGTRLQLVLRSAGDRLAADDRAELVVPPPRTLSVLVVSPKPDPFTALALLACAGEGDLAVRTALPSEWTPETPCDLLVCDGWLPPAWPGTAPAIVVDPPGPPPGIALRRLAGDGLAVEGPRVLDGAHPLLHAVATRRLALTQTAVIEAESGVEPLWASPAGALLAAATVRGRRVAVLGFAPARSEQLPLSAAFPLLMANAVNWAVQGEDEQAPAVLRTGALVDAASALAWDGAAAPAPGEARPRELDRVGAWTAAGGLAGTAALLSSTETALPGQESAAAVAAGRALGDLATPALWLVVALLLLEAWLFHRRGVS